MALKRIATVIFDLDPVLARPAASFVPHINQVLASLEQHRIRTVLLTNDSLHTPEECAALLHKRGLQLDSTPVYPAYEFLAYWLSERTPRATLYLMTSEPVRKAMEERGLRVIEGPEEIGHLCDYVVTGTHPTFSYDALTEAWKCYEMGAGFVAVDIEPLVPGTEDLPGGGPTAAALQTLLNKPPLYTAGMPNPDWLRYLAQELKTPADQCVLIGHLRRDPVAAAQAAGMQAIVIADSEPTHCNEEPPANASGPSSVYLSGYEALPRFLEQRLKAAE